MLPVINNKVLRNFANKNLKKENIFHTSGIASTQSGASIGSGTSGISVERRKEMMHGNNSTMRYSNSRIMRDATALRRANQYIPRTEGGANSLYGNRGAALGTNAATSAPSASAQRVPSANLRPISFGH